MSAVYAQDVVAKAREYYNSADADNFYFHVWGGEDIHIGLYQQDNEAIAVASRRTVEYMATLLPNLGADSLILDLGSGYGGAARHLAKRHGCQITALNLSETENARHRGLNKALGVDALIDVVDGNFEQVPAPADHFHVVWSQDAILHSGQRLQVIQEVARVLKPGGDFVFTDPMQSDDCPKGVLQPVLDRIHLQSLGSFAFYREAAAQAGLVEVDVVPMTEQLIRHYNRVHDELLTRRSELTDKVTDAYVQRMLAGLRHWVHAGEAGYLAWGVMHFRKPL